MHDNSGDFSSSLLHVLTSVHRRISPIMFASACFQKSLRFDRWFDPRAYPDFGLQLPHGYIFREDEKLWSTSAATFSSTTSVLRSELVIEHPGY